DRLFVAATLPPSVLTNGDFGDAVTSNGTGGGWTSANVDAAGGWKSDGTFVLNSNGSPSTDPSLSQTLTGLVAGQRYRVSGDYRNDGAAFGDDTAGTFGVFVGGARIFSAKKSDAPESGPHKHFAVEFTAASATQTLTLKGEIGSDTAWRVDNLAVQAVGTTTVFDTAFVPVAVLSPDAPVTYGDAFSNYRTAHLTAQTYSGGEPVYDPLTCSFPIDPKTCRPLTYAGGEPVRDVFSGDLVLDPYNISIDVPASAGGSFVLGGAGLGTVALDGSFSPIALAGGATRYRISGNFAGAGAVTATAGATTVVLGDVVSNRAFIHQEPLRHEAGDPMAHIAGEPVVALRGEIVRYLGGEKTFDENGEQVFNGSSPFLHAGGQAVIHDRRERAFDLVGASGTIVPLLDADAPYAPFVFAYDPAAPLTSLSIDLPSCPAATGRYCDLLGAVGSTPAARAFVTVYDGTLIYNLAPDKYTVDFANDEIDLGSGLPFAGRAVTLKVTIAVPAVQAAGDPVLWYGDEPLAIGQPIVDSGGNLVYDAAGQVALHTAATIAPVKRQAFTFRPDAAGKQAFTLELAPRTDLGAITVLFNGVALTSSQYTLTTVTKTVSPRGATPWTTAIETSGDAALGSRTVVTYVLTVDPAGTPATGRVEVSYRGQKVHARGEPKYVFSAAQNQWVQQTYAGGEARFTLGNEALLRFGGEQTYFTAEDVVQTDELRYRITIAGPLGSGAVAEIQHYGVEQVELDLGAGNDIVTVVQTHDGATTIRTHGGDDHVAVRSIDGATTIDAGAGNDAIDVGSAAGQWNVGSYDAPELAFRNDRGTLNLIHASLTIHGGSGTDTLTVDDRADGASNVGILTSNSLLSDSGAAIATLLPAGHTGLFGAGGAITLYDGFETLTIELGSAPGGNALTIRSTHTGTTNVRSGSGADLVNIESIAGLTFVFTGAGDDHVRIGSATGVADPIGGSTLNEIDNARLTLAAEGGHDELSAYDSADTASNSGTLTATRITGLGMTLGIEYAGFEELELRLSKGADDFFVDSTPAGSSLLVNGGDEAPILNDFTDVININSIAGPAIIEGGRGNDIIRVNFDQTGQQTFQNGIAGVLTLRGQQDGDLYEIGLSGAPNALANLTLINVDDQGPAPPGSDPGRNVLRVYGTDDANTFLFRARHAEDTLDPTDVSTAMIAAYQVDANGNAVPGGFIERINYDGEINGGVQVFGRKGDDTFVLDDNLAGLVLFGDEGNDTFQVGQVFASARDGFNPDNGLDPMDYFKTTLTTRGWLSNGISRSATLFGGTGNDNFTVYHNLAELFLFGEEDDDTFLIRAFVRVNPNDPKAPFTNVNGGQGADFISYTVNAPVRVEGGDGLDTLTIVGTEFGDDFVVTDRGVFGAGLFVTYAGIEKLVVDAQEGNDRFYVASTSENVALEILGGLGSDVFNIGGGNDGQAITVVSNSLRGHNGLIEQLLAGNDPDFAGIFAQDLSVQIADNDEAGVVVRQVNGPLRVFESPDAPAGLIVGTYEVVLTRAPTESVRFTAAPVPGRERERLAGGRGIQINGSDGGVTLLFDRDNWFIPQLLTVTAPDDELAEGTRFINIQHTLSQGSSPDDGGAYDGLAVPGVVVEVVDDDAADVTIVTVTPVGDGGTADDGTLIAENPSGDLPAFDRYAVMLSKQPLGDVRIAVSIDGEGFVQRPAGATIDPTCPVGTPSSLVLCFTTSNWNVAQFVDVLARDDNEKEALHFARVTHVLTSDFDDYYGLVASDVARGLAGQVAGDPVTRFDASVSGSTITITGPAFTVDLDSTYGSATVTGTKAFTGPLTVTIAGTPIAGVTYTLTLDTRNFRYTAEAGDLAADVAQGLVEAIELGSTFNATHAGAVVMLNSADLGPFTAKATIVDQTGAAYGASTATLAGTLATNHYAEAQITISVPAGAPIPAGALWTLTVSAGSAISDMGLYSYLAGSNGESVQPPPVDARVTDDDAPGLLVLESGGGTNVTEPTHYVVLGEGFVTQLISNSPTTSFLGDFGLALLQESGIHNTIETAQDLELGEFNRNANPDIADLTGDARLEPHLTVRGSGDGGSDFYSFEITQAMIDAAGSDGVQASFDIDHGYDIGDPKFWLSLLTIYNAAGDLIARGPGFSNPLLAGAGGSSTYFDDFLTHTFTQAGRYVVEVGSWLFSSGLPVGVDYELQVSIEAHATSGFLFAPEPVLEREPTAAGCAVDPAPLSCAQALTADDFFRFFDPNVGDQAYGGTIDFATPYARIQGSGDGTFDLFSFVVTSDMLNPTAVSPTSPLPAGSTKDTSTYFTTVSLRLDGAVHEHDVWKLGIRYRDYSVEAGHDEDLEAIANRLADELPDRFTTSVTKVGGVVTLTISDPQGFTLSGLQVDGVAQRAFAAGTVTRTAEPRLASGAVTPVNFAATPVSFTRADVTLAGTVTKGDVWSVRVNATTKSTSALDGDTLVAIAGRLRGMLGAIASGIGATITLTDAAGFSVRASVSGDAPDATPVIDGTPVAGQAATVPYTQVRYTLPAVLRPGETYEVRVRNLDGTGELIRTAPAVTPADTPATVAAALASAANAAGYSASGSAGVLTISRATPFTSTIAVAPAGSMTLDPGSAVVSKTLTLINAFQAADVWRVTLSETNGTAIAGATATASGTVLADVARDLATAISTIGGFRAAAEGAKLTITRTTGADFNVAVTIDPAASIAQTASNAAIVTVPTGSVAAGDQYVLTVDGTTFTRTPAAGNANGVASDLAALVDASAAYTAIAFGNDVFILKIAAGALAASLAITPASGSASTVTGVTRQAATLSLSGTPHIGDTWNASLTPTASGSLATGAFTIPDTPPPTIGAVAADLRSDLNGTTFLVLRQTDPGGVERLTITRRSATDTAFSAVVAITPSASSSVAAATTRMIALAGPANAGDSWTVTVDTTNVVTYTVATSSASADAVAAALASSTTAADIDELTGYTAFASGGTLYVTKIAGGTLTLAKAIARDPAAALPTVAGTVFARYESTVRLEPAGATAVQNHDTWTLTINGTPYDVEADSNDTLADILDKLRGELPASFTSSDDDAATITVAAGDGTALTIAAVLQDRPDAFETQPGAQTDTRDHYFHLTFDLSGDTGTGGFSPGERWALVVDGRTYVYTVPSGLPPEQRNLRTIAGGLAALVAADSTAPFTASLVAGSEPRILVSDRHDDTPDATPLNPTDTLLADGDDPFVFEVKRGGGSVLGVFDVDGAGVTAGSAVVPLIPAEYQRLIELYPYFASFFPADVVDFVARPVIQILAPDGSVLAQNGDPTPPGFVPNPADLGSASDAGPGTTVDPFLEYLFAAPGTYYVRVGSYKQWAHFTRGGLANTFTVDGLEGVATGTGYSLLASVQRHDTNADAISLVGKTLTIVAGTGKGQQAVITGYNPEYMTTSGALDEAYTLDRAFAIAPDPTSRFEIADTPTIPPVDDSYDLVLTGTPGAGKTVVVDVLPRPTRTYDAAQAFNPAANFGEADEVQVEVATGRARLKLTGTPAFGERWIVTLDDQSFGYDVRSGDTLADVAAGLVAVIDGFPGYDASVVVDDPSTAGVNEADATAFVITGTAAFYASFAITPDTRGGFERLTEVRGFAVPAGAVALQLTGFPANQALSTSLATAERWTLTVDNHDYVYDVKFRDDLATIARALGSQIPTTIYDVTISGRVITIGRDDGTPVVATIHITPHSAGGAVVTPQVTFTDGDWDQRHTVLVRAVDDDFVDGGDALVFPALEERVNAIRGPITIDGAVRADSERFLKNPLLLPGESNEPLPDGPIDTVGTTPSGDATITDTDATHVNAATGERPGFDPRMNDFAYTGTFLSGAAEGVVLDVAPGGVSKDILSIARPTAFNVSPTFNGASIAGKAIFLGTPEQSGAATIHWLQAEIELGGLPRDGQVWTLRLDGVAYNYTVVPGDDVPSRIARALQAIVPSAYVVETRIDVLGGSRLIVRRANGAAFTAAFSIGPAPDGSASRGTSVISGAPLLSDVTSHRWTMAALRLLTPGVAGDIWSLGVSGTVEAATSPGAGCVAGTGSSFTCTGTASYTVLAGDDIAKVTSKLAKLIRGFAIDYQPLVSGTQVTFTKGFEAGHVAVAGDTYTVAPLNLNTRVDEIVQVDTLNVFDANSPSNDSATLTQTRLTGLGMGGDTFIADRAFDGGITYANIEALNIELGSGDDTLTVESTHTGTTHVSTGRGDDTIVVKTVQGHTTFVTGDGNDKVTVGNDEGLVDQVTALLTIDTGAGEDSVSVNDASDVNDNAGVLTDSTLTGLDMPTVPEVQTIFVQAASGTYKLGLQGSATQVTVAYNVDAAGFAAAVATLLGHSDVRVTVHRQVVDGHVLDVTYTVTLLREHAGVNIAQLLVTDTAGLTPNADASVITRAATVVDGTTAPLRTTVQTIAMQATGGTFVIHVVRPDDDGILRDYATAPIAFDASAADVEAALSAIINPNNAFSHLPHTDNVGVERFAGKYVVEGVTHRYQVTFRGEDAFNSIGYLDASGLTGGGVRLATLTSGIAYYGVETLNIALGSGSDVFNVQGTSAVTNVKLAGGDDRIYVSSQADVGVAGHPDFLRGRLDDLRGTLNLDAGAGRHTLMISDEASASGDGAVRITEDRALAAAVDPNVATDGEIYVTGLAPRAISYRATAVTGNFAGGITYWTGSGADTISIDGTHVRAGVQTLTALNTGLGNDVVTVDVDAGEDDALVVDAQGQAQHVLAIAGGLSAGDHNAPADAVSVSVDGTPLNASQFTVHHALGTVDLHVNPPTGAIVAVQIARSTVRAFTLAASGDVTFTGLALGDQVFATVNGVAATPVVSGTTLHFAAAPAGALVVVRIVKTTTQTFTVPQTFSSDDDTVNAQASTLGLVIFGGQGDDTINGGTGGDVVFGDRGRVLYFDAGQPLPPVGAGLLDAAALATLEAFATTVRGHGGPGDKTDGTSRALSVAISVDTTLGGHDVITTGVGPRDIVIGGADDDSITTNRGETTTPDGAAIVFGDNGLVDFALRDGAPADVDRIWSIDPDTGGSDTITTGNGDDVVIAGEDGERVLEQHGLSAGSSLVVVERYLADGDTVVAGNGRNLVFGDNGRVTAAVANGAGFGALALTLGLVESIETLIGGSDTITTGSGSDIVVGGIDADTIAAGDGNNIVFGDGGVIDWTAAERGGTLAGDDLDAADIDRIWSLDPDHGGSDVITTGAGDDIVIAGEDGELVDDVSISGFNAVARNVVRDTVRGDGDSVNAGDGRNLVFGDNGRISASAQAAPRFGAQPLTLGIVESVESLIGGSDQLTTGAGSDIVVGGIDADTIAAGDGHNIVFGDGGVIDWAAAERGGTLAGDDLDPSDIDRIWSLDPDNGGSDVITTGAGDDIVIAGEDGELVDDVAVAGLNAIPRTVLADAARGNGDTVNAGDGQNIVLGDSGQITAAGSNLAAYTFGNQPLRLREITTIAPDRGGNDTITTGAGKDIVLGGVLNDTITAGAGLDVVLGDNGRVTFLETTPATVTSGSPEARIDLVQTTDHNDGGADVINGGLGEDLLIGGAAADAIDGDENDDLIFGDEVWLARRPLLVTNPRFEALDGTTIYGRTDQSPPAGYAVANDTSGFAYVNDGDSVWRDYRDPDGAGNDVPDWARYVVVDLFHSDALTYQAVPPVTDTSVVPSPKSQTYGGDNIAGGAGHDTIFGERGDDTIQGDGSIEARNTAAQVLGPDTLPLGAGGTVPAGVLPSDASGYLVGARRVITAGVVEDLWISPSFENAATDGDDYIEGGGGADTIFGGLGQDDIIGGSSSLFTLTTAAQRPDGADLIFGGAGVKATYNDAGTGTTHSLDADTILGDNGNIWRLVGTTSGTTVSLTATFLSLNYDNYGAGRKLVVRATELLDYTPGGPDFLPTSYTAGAGFCRSDGAGFAAGTLFDRGAANEVHGESGDDTIYGGCGNDRLFGDAADDDLIGGWGSDWISGGSGQDGVIGDDGRIFTSRNGTAEPLYGIAATTQQDITANGNAQAATINVTGTLAKAVDITPFNLKPSALGPDDPYFDPLYADDVIFGGLGDDFLHGAAGDDAISGAEALPLAYAADRVGGVQTQIVRSDFTRPYNPGDLLHYGHGTRTNAFALYDGANPLVKVTVAGSEFFLNFDAANGPIPAGGTVASDGRDLVFGGDGNDWLVGGSGRDDLWGGWGDDLLNTDDNLGTHSGLNDQAEDNLDYEDRAYGGGGLDVLLGNTSGDRLIDWVGEFNSYFVPFNPFGLGTVSRQLAPGLAEYLYALSKADGADPTRATDIPGAAAVRNGEPQGEIGLLEQQDPKYEDQRGNPSDPQGPVGGGTSPAVFVSGAASVVEGAAGTTRTVTLTLTLSSPAAGGETVAYATSNGTATASSDYTAASGVVTFAAGATTATITLTVLGDDVAEPDETFVVTLSSPSGLVLGSPSSSTVTISNDDVAGARSVSIADTSVTEGNSASKTVTLTLTLSAPAVGGETVAWATSNGTAAAGSDYTAASGFVTFAAGATTATFSVTVIGDSVVEPNETFVVTLSSPTGGLTLGSPSSATVTILNDDAARSVSIANTSVTEGNSGSKAVTLTLTLSAPAVGGETVAWATSNGTATAGSDYTAASGVVTFAAGATTATFSVTVIGDNVVEPNETFVVTLSSPTGGLSLGSPSSATVTILNDDAARSVTIAGASTAEGNSGSKTVTLTLTLSAPAVGGETVAWATSNGTATAGSDYNAASGTVTFAAGATSATISVTVLGDRTAESDETFFVMLTNPTGGLTLGTPATATVTIVSDDGVTPRTVTIAAATVTEGNSGSKTVTLTLTLSSAAVGNETVAWATSNGTATAGSDYTAASGIATFAAGATTATISVTVIGDATVEPNETFTVTLSNPTGSLTLGSPSSATVTITNDDAPPSVSIAGAS
ncbi:MAG: large repetitive protein, partial [bacterium]